MQLKHICVLYAAQDTCACYMSSKSTYLQYTDASDLHSCGDLVYVSYNLVRQPLYIFGRRFDLLI